MRLSIILPIYNVEKYIYKCFESLYAQNLNEDDFEIIAVNDGSSDNSIDVLNPFLKEHMNIILLNQENQGVAIARNNGLKIAKGEYVLFVDPDDFLIPDSLIELLNKAYQSNLDILVGKYIKVEDSKLDSISLEKIEKRSDVLLFDKIDYFIQCYNPNEGYAWVNLYKRSFLNINNLNFFPNISFTEDTLFTIKAFTFAHRVGASSTVFYVYVQHHGSAMSTMNAAKLCSMNTVISEIWKLKFLPISPLYAQKINVCLFAMLSVLMWYLSHYSSLRKERKTVLKDLHHKCPHLFLKDTYRQILISIIYKCFPLIYLSLRYKFANKKY